MVTVSQRVLTPCRLFFFPLSAVGEAPQLPLTSAANTFVFPQSRKLRVNLDGTSDAFAVRCANQVFKASFCRLFFSQKASSFLKEVKKKAILSAPWCRFEPFSPRRTSLLASGETSSSDQEAETERLTSHLNDRTTSTEHVRHDHVRPRKRRGGGKFAVRSGEIICC